MSILWDDSRPSPPAPNPISGPISVSANAIVNLILDRRFAVWYNRYVGSIDMFWFRVVAVLIITVVSVSFCMDLFMFIADPSTVWFVNLLASVGEVAGFIFLYVFIDNLLRAQQRQQVIDRVTEAYNRG